MSSMPRTYRTHEFSTSSRQDRTIAIEEKLLKVMDALHSVFATHANSKVSLTELGADDFGISTELKTTVDALVDSGITFIPGRNKPMERTQLVAGALQIL